MTELTDEQSLQLAEDCLARGQQLVPLDLDRTKTKQAAVAAWEMATGVQHRGSTDGAKTRGRQLAAAALALSRGQPPE